MLSDAGLIFGQNLVFIGFSLLVAMFFTCRLLMRRDLLSMDVRYLMAGVALVAVGSLSHRAWWTIWGYIKGQEYDPFEQWALAHSLWITMPAVALVAVGYSFHLYPFLSRLWPMHWKLALTGFAAALWIIGVLLT